MSVFMLDPLNDSRWGDLVASHPRASVFHHPGWLNALAATYGYRPIAITSTPPGEPLQEAIVFCEVRSAFTGNRLVSLPFSDHVDPLLNDRTDLSIFSDWIKRECLEHNLKYCELRPLTPAMNSDSPFVESQCFWFHVLDLTPSLGKIFTSLHKSCIQRRIQRAEREHLTYEKGCSSQLIDDFYRLMRITRRRHQVLPQPKAWFRNIVACTGPDVTIRLIRKGGLALAATLTLKHGRTIVYKYGCSDERFHYLCGMPLLFWRMIEEGKADGADQIDFGRTELENTGLLAFKDRLGTSRTRITYVRYPGDAAGEQKRQSRVQATKRLISIVPGSMCPLASRFLYRHIG